MCYHESIEREKDTMRGRENTIFGDNNVIL